MNFGPERLSIVFAAIGISLLGCFLYSPWSENQFDDYVAISSNPVDIGQIACFEKGQGEFTLTNRTKLPMPYRLKADCSCTRLPTTTGIIEPKGEQVVQFTYTPKSKAKLDSSLQQESSDVVITLVADGALFSKIVEINAQGVFPLLLDPQGLSNVVEPFRASEVAVPLAIAKDVKNVKLISAPSFLTESRIEQADGLSTFRANIEMPIGIHRGPVALELTVGNVSKPVRIVLPIAVVVEKPYAFSTDICALRANSECVIEVRPEFGALRSSFVTVESECRQLTAQIQEGSPNAIKLVCTASDDAQLPITGRIHVSVQSTDAEGRELTTEDEIPVVLSRGGLSDE